MPLYQFFALDGKGKKEKGMIEAENIEIAKSLLDKKNLAVTKISSFSSFSKKFKISKSELLGFTEALSKLLSAGLSLYESLFALKDKYNKHKFYPLILDLSDQIKRGKSFSSALSTYPGVFDLLYCSMIANAEKSGSLVETLEELAQNLRKQQTLRKKVVGALIYPAILGVFCFVVIFCLIFFVVPSLFDLFEGKNLHPFTKIVFSVSQFANASKLYLFIGFIFFCCFIGWCVFSVSLRKKVFKTVLKAPFIKDLMVKVSIIRFCRAFSVLLSTGISYIEALNLSKKVMNNPVLEDDITYAEEKVTEGKKLSFALKKKGNIPPLAIRMLEIAEESAKMVDMLKHIVVIYDDELDKSLSKLTSLLQPLLLVILGAVVGFIVLSVLLPLTDMSSFMN